MRNRKEKRGCDREKNRACSAQNILLIFGVIFPWRLLIWIDLCLYQAGAVPTPFFQQQATLRHTPPSPLSLQTIRPTARVYISCADKQENLSATKDSGDNKQVCFSLRRGHIDPKKARGHKFLSNMDTRLSRTQIDA